MKNILILFFFILLFSCSEEECEKPKKLIKFGGFGRNEISFLANGKEVWYSKVDASNGEKGLDLLSFPTEEYNFIWARFTNLNTCDVYDSDYNFFSFSIWFDSSNDVKINREFTYFNGFGFDPAYELDSLSPLKITFYYNENDSIIYGSFEGKMYHNVYLDTLFITKGNFDFKVF